MYATKEDMIDRYGGEILVELTDRASEPTGEIDEGVLGRAFEDAGAQINSFIGARYALPLAEAPLVLVTHACVIAYYKLHRGRHTDEVRKEYEDTLSFLKSVARGDASLDIGGKAPASAPADARVDGPERIFSRDSLKGF